LPPVSNKGWEKPVIAVSNRQIMVADRKKLFIFKVKL
jgi:hypothetical protein